MIQGVAESARRMTLPFSREILARGRAAFFPPLKPMVWRLRRDAKRMTPSFLIRWALEPKELAVDAEPTSYEIAKPCGGAP